MKKNIFSFFLLSLCLIILFKNNLEIHDAIINACTLFMTKLFPSLFPMMILSDLLLYFKIPDLIAKTLAPIWPKIFHTNPYGAFVFFISCFSGTPTNAYIIKNLVTEKKLNSAEATHLLGFSFFNNPLFLYTMLSLIFPNNYLTVLKILIIPYIINLFLGIIIRPSTKQDTAFIFNEKKENLGEFLSNSIKNTMNTLLFILGSISLFFILNTILNPQNYPFLTGFLEISQGLNALLTPLLSLKAKELLAIFFISFGGLSIHLQIKGILSNTTISYLSFFRYRLLESSLSLFIIAVI